MFQSCHFKYQKITHICVENNSKIKAQMHTLEHRYETVSGDMMRAYLEYRSNMKEHMKEFEGIWKTHCEKLKDSMEEVVKIEEAIAHQGKVLIRDGQDALKRIDVDQDISQLVIRNQDLIVEPARVVCIRRESLAIKNARKKFNVRSSVFWSSPLETFLYNTQRAIRYRRSDISERNQRTVHGQRVLRVCSVERVQRILILLLLMRL